MDTYVITRLDHWTDEQWEDVIDSVEETVVAVAESWEE